MLRSTTLPAVAREEEDAPRDSVVRQSEVTE